MSNDLSPAAPEGASIDAEYDPERRVGSRQPFIDWYVRESALARKRLECRMDVRYGPTPAETLDLFPSSEPGSPVLLYIHGGYWRALSSKEFSFVANGLVPHGVTVAVMNYALCPQVTIADITRQSQAAVAWLAENARLFSADPSRLFVAGHSAGGQQVGMLLSGDGGPAGGSSAGGAGTISGGITISGLFDLRPLRHSWLQPTLQLTERACEDQSPLLRIPRQAPPLLVSVGSEESAAFIGQSHSYHAAWRAAGLAGRYYLQPGANHYTAIYGLGDRASPLAQMIAEFLR
jgi:arylformamidase